MHKKKWGILGITRGSKRREAVLPAGSLQVCLYACRYASQHLTLWPLEPLGF